MDRFHPSSAKQILQGAEIFHGNIKSDSSRGQEDHMHDGNQRYKIHIRLHGRHRGKGAGHAEAQSAMRTPGNTVAAQGAAPGNAAGPAPARDGEITADGGAPHAPGACLPDAHAPRGQPAQQTGGQPHGAEPAAIFPHTVFGTFLPGKWSRESYGERRRQGIPQRNAPHGQKEGNPHCRSKGKPPPVTGFFPTRHRMPLPAGRSGGQAVTPK